MHYRTSSYRCRCIPPDCAKEALIRHSKLPGAYRENRGVALLPGICRRIKDTPSQTGLPWKEREKNIRNAFSCEADLGGKHVAMLDDVMTTGATLNELAKALRKSGAAHVSGWVVARTLSSHDKFP